MLVCISGYPCMKDSKSALLGRVVNISLWSPIAESFNATPGCVWYVIVLGQTLSISTNDTVLRFLDVVRDKLPNVYSLLLKSTLTPPAYSHLFFVDSLLTSLSCLTIFLGNLTFSFLYMVGCINDNACISCNYWESSSSLEIVPVSRNSSILLQIEVPKPRRCFTSLPEVTV